MAKKKRPSSGKGPKKGPKKPPKTGGRSSPKDRARTPETRAAWETIEKIGELLGIVGPGRGPETPLEQARDLVAQAHDAPTDERRMELARKALELSPDCVEAYALLADHARTRKE